MLTPTQQPELHLQQVTKAVISSQGSIVHFHLFMFLLQNHCDDHFEASSGWLPSLLCVVGYVFILKQ